MLRSGSSPNKQDLNVNSVILFVYSIVIVRLFGSLSPGTKVLVRRLRGCLVCHFIQNTVVHHRSIPQIWWDDNISHISTN
jgi:hypothetical protein